MDDDRCEVLPRVDHVRATAGARDSRGEVISAAGEPVREIDAYDGAVARVEMTRSRVVQICRRGEDRVAALVAQVQEEQGILDRLVEGDLHADPETVALRVGGNALPGYVLEPRITDLGGRGGGAALLAG